MSRKTTMRHRQAKAPAGSTVKTSIQVPADVHREIDRRATEAGLSWNAIASALLREALAGRRGR